MLPSTEAVRQKDIHWRAEGREAAGPFSNNRELLWLQPKCIRKFIMKCGFFPKYAQVAAFAHCVSCVRSHHRRAGQNVPGICHRDQRECRRGTARATEEPALSSAFQD